MENPKNFQSVIVINSGNWPVSSATKFRSNNKSVSEMTSTNNASATDPYRCLICFEVIKEENEHLKEKFPVDNFLKCLKIDGSNVNFLKENFKKVTWSYFCSACEKNLEEVFKIFGELQRLNQILEEFGDLFKNLIQDSFAEDDGNSNCFINDIRKCFFEKLHLTLPCDSTKNSLSFVEKGSPGKKQPGNQNKSQKSIPASKSTTILPSRSGHNLRPRRSSRLITRPTVINLEEQSSADEDDEHESYVIDPDFIDSPTTKSESEGEESPLESENKTRKSKSTSKPGGNSSSTKKFLLRCETCNKRSFPTTLHLRAHQRKYHEGERKPYDCKICTRKFSKPSHLKAHEIRWHSEPTVKSLSCLQCPMMFKSSEALEAHVLRCHQGVRKPYTCSDCEKSFRHKLHLDEHLLQHANSKNFKCADCSKNFVSERKLRVHRANAHFTDAKRRYQCEECPKKFSKLCYLEGHMFHHTGQSQFICEICGQHYGSRKSFLAHLDRHKAPGQKTEAKFPCDKCPTTFVESRSLKYHVLTVHENTFRFHCKICGKGVQALSKLKRHMVCHSEEKQFKCDDCGKEFKRKHQLSQHLLLHEGNFPFKCCHCDKGFRVREHLKNHEKLHTGEKPFKCEICQKSYALKHYLTTHINAVHKGRRQKKTKIGPRLPGHSTSRVKPLSEIYGSADPGVAGGGPPNGLIADSTISSVSNKKDNHNSVEPPVSQSTVSTSTLGDVTYEWIQFGFAPGIPAPALIDNID